MKDKLFKLRVLFWLIRDACGMWRSECWQKDLNDLWCCDGRECGCYGMTVRQMWKESIDQ